MSISTNLRIIDSDIIPDEVTKPENQYSNTSELHHTLDISVEFLNIIAKHGCLALAISSPIVSDICRKNGWACMHIPMPRVRSPGRRKLELSRTWRRTSTWDSNSAVRCQRLSLRFGGDGCTNGSCLSSLGWGTSTFPECPPADDLTKW